MKNLNPIGIFDSGLGGLTVARQIQKVLPNESIIYYGDTARVPYGSKSKDTIIKFTREAVKFLQSHNAKCIVVACNTASALALPIVRNEFDIPMIGVINPGAKAAAKKTTSGKVGVIATTATINSDAYTNAIREINNKITVYSQPCPLLVPLVEEGWGEKTAAKLIIQEYLTPLKTANVDTLVLGCTHYPLLTKQIQDFVSDKVALVDSATTCADDLKILLEKGNLISDVNNTQSTFFVTDMAAKFSELGAKFLGKPLNAIKVVGNE
jgi:glutamate racemase